MRRSLTSVLVLALVITATCGGVEVYAGEKCEPSILKIKGPCPTKVECTNLDELLEKLGHPPACTPVPCTAVPCTSVPCDPPKGPAKVLGFHRAEKEPCEPTIRYVPAEATGHWITLGGIGIGPRRAYDAQYFEQHHDPWIRVDEQRSWTARLGHGYVWPSGWGLLPSLTYEHQGDVSADWRLIDTGAYRLEASRRTGGFGGDLQVVYLWGAR